MTHPLILQIRRDLRDAADPARAPAMQAYMKSAMPFLGVSAPAQRAICRTALNAAPLTSFDEWRDVTLGLWRNATYREERHAAITIADARKFAGFRTKAALPMLEEMIVSGAWWDLVDALATHCLGDVLRAETAAGGGASMRRTLRAWAAGPDLWKRRSAMLCQVLFKRDTDTELLFACIEPSLLDLDDGRGAPRKGAAPDIRHDFFIRKAIGWALRSYARGEPDEVRQYVERHRARLSPLSIREALKNVHKRR